MTRTLITAALFAATLAATAAQAEDHRFTRDGETFSYSVTQKADRTIIQGRRAQGPAFHYVLYKGRVSGWNGDIPVDFAVTPATSPAPIELSRR